MMRFRGPPPKPAGSRREFDAIFLGPVLGMDEVGLGCIAGPVYAAGVVLPDDREFLIALEQMGLKDSKRLTEPSRERIAQHLIDQEVFFFVDSASVAEMDRFGLSSTLTEIFRRICKHFHETVGPKTVLLDGPRRAKLGFPHRGIVKGDDKSLSIAAAACLAKVARDEEMRRVGREFPHFNWAKNKGYPTADHLAALQAYGVTDHHRKYTRPVQALCFTASGGQRLAADP